MRNLCDELKNRKIDFNLLEGFGFKDVCGIKICEIETCNKEFFVQIRIDGDDIFSQMIERVSGDEYALVDVQSATGAYVGGLRAEYEEIVLNFIECCSFAYAKLCPQADEVMEYIAKRYGDRLEYLWKNNDSAIWRNKNNSKWYGVLMNISRDKLGLDSSEQVYVMNLRCANVSEISDNTSFFPGFHMNKKHWISIVLDGSVPFTVLCDMIDESYAISGRKK